MLAINLRTVADSSSTRRYVTWLVILAMLLSMALGAIAVQPADVSAEDSPGEAWAWGRNAIGQLGDGTTTDRTTPVAISGLADVATIAVGQAHGLVIQTDGTVWSWGYNPYGQLGDGTTEQRLAPVQVEGLPSITAIAAGTHHSLAVAGDGTVWAWGNNSVGQLGDGTQIQRLTPVQVSGLTGVVAVAAGSFHSIAMTSDGTVWAWGANHQGQLGDGTTSPGLTPVQVVGLAGVTDISAAQDHNLAVVGDGTVRAWGDNAFGQLGDGTTTEQWTPVQVSGLTGIASVETGWFHSLALTMDGAAWAWGRNSHGQLGDGTTADQLTPIHISSIANVVAVAAGQFHSMSLLSNGEIQAWGRNTYGQLGDGTTLTRLAPVPISGLMNIFAIATSADSSFVLLNQSTLNTSPIAEIVHPSEALFEGQEVELGSIVTDPDPGDSHTYAWSVEGIEIEDTSSPTLRFVVHDQGDYTISLTVTDAAGESWFAGGSVNVNSVEPSATFNAPTSVAVGESFTLSLTDATDPSSVDQAAGFSYAFDCGSGFGPFGPNNTASCPTSEGGVLEVAGRISDKDEAYNTYTAVVLVGASASAGEVWAWGHNVNGAIGDGTTTQRLVPVQASGLTNITAISANGSHSLALDADGTVWAWGGNASGQLGDGTTTARNTPIQVSGLTNVVAVAAGEYHSLALKDDGTVWAWGQNLNGQFGDGTSINRSTPAPANNLTNVVAIAAGLYHSLALKDDGTVWVWGSDGTPSVKWTPAQVSGLTNVTAVAAGRQFSLVLKGDGTVWGWGINTQGRLGDGTSTRRNTPVQVSGLTTAVGIAIGKDHGLALTADGSVWGWGRNSDGQLGDGTTNQQLTPVQVSELSNVTTVTSGFDHNLALKADGTVWGWGKNTYGQIGDDTKTNRLTPVQVNSLANVTAIAAATQHSLALARGFAPNTVPVSVSGFMFSAPTVADGYKLTTRITVQAEGAPVSGADVTIEYIDPSGAIVTETATTNSNGVAAFNRIVTDEGGYVVNVTSITKTGYLYDPDGNLATTMATIAGTSNGPEAYVTRIVLSSEEFAGGWVVTGKVTAYAGSQPAVGALVSATLTGPDGVPISVVAAVANAAGLATLVQVVPSSGEYVLEVTDITLGGFSYDVRFNTLTSAALTIDPLPAGPIHVSEMTLNATPTETGHQLTTTVTIQMSGIAAANASVTIQIVHPDGKLTNLTRTTNKNGQATFNSQVKLTGDYTIAVTNVSRYNYSYVANQNVVTSLDITLN